MSLHTYTKCWLHIIWGTLNRDKLLATKDSRKKASTFLYEYAKSKNIYMINNYVNSDHVHALINLSSDMSIESALHLLKGASSRLINSDKLISTKFSWGRGYGAFSVSESTLQKTIEYIEKQEEHHRAKSFIEEYQSFIKLYGLKYIDE